MVDAHDSKSCLARGGGSSPLSGTNKQNGWLLPVIFVYRGGRESQSPTGRGGVARFFNRKILVTESSLRHKFIKEKAVEVIYSYGS